MINNQNTKNINYKENIIDPLTLNEYKLIIQSMPNNKAPGLSGITNELIKIIYDETLSILYEVLTIY